MAHSIIIFFIYQCKYNLEYDLFFIYILFINYEKT